MALTSLVTVRGQVVLVGSLLGLFRVFRRTRTHDATQSNIYDDFTVRFHAKIMQYSKYTLTHSMMKNVPNNIQIQIISNSCQLLKIKLNNVHNYVPPLRTNNSNPAKKTKAFENKTRQCGRRVAFPGFVRIDRYCVRGEPDTCKGSHTVHCVTAVSG